MRELVRIFLFGVVGWSAIGAIAALFVWQPVVGQVVFGTIAAVGLVIALGQRCRRS